MVAAGRGSYLTDVPAAGMVQQQQQQEQPLAVAVGLPPAPQLQHLELGEDEQQLPQQQQQQQQQQMRMKPQLPQLDIAQLQPCSGQEELAWTPERLTALLLSSVDEVQPADGTAAVVEAAAPKAAGDDDEAGSSGDDATCTVCDGQALLAISQQAAELEKQMLPLFTHEGVADDGAAAAAAGADGAHVQGTLAEGAADGHDSGAGAAGSSHASTAGTAAAAGLCHAAAAAADDDECVQTEEDHEQEKEDLVQQEQQRPRRGLRQQQQQQGKVASQRLPPKDAQPGDYLKVEPNSSWNPQAFEAAAAAGAAQLGVCAAVPAPQPAVQSSGQEPQQLSGHASDKVPPGSAAAAEAPTSDASAAATSAVTAAEASEVQLPDAACSAEFGVLMLAHDVGVTHAAAWQAWEEAHAGRVVVMVHLKEGVTLPASAAGADWLASGRQLHTRVASQWGDISLTQAVLSSAAEMLQRCPRLQHIAVVSGQDVPVAALQLPLPPGASVIGCFQFGREYDAAARLVAAAVLQQQLGMSKAEAAAWGDSLTFHHTWLIFSR
jgi:hypothetical protein